MKQRKSVLVVTADAAAREHLTRWCLEQGYAVTAVCHPRRALAAASCHGFAAAIVDQPLPETEGLRLSKRLKGLVADLKVLVLSSDPDGPSSEEALESGADALLHLPCSLEQIGSRLDRMLGARPRTKQRIDAGKAFSSSPRVTAERPLGIRAQDAASMADR